MPRTRVKLGWQDSPRAFSMGPAFSLCRLTAFVFAPFKASHAMQGKRSAREGYHTIFGLSSKEYVVTTIDNRARC